jgi:asparagine synthetase B (glutamine-hydrolysing)
MRPHNTEMDLSIACALYFASRGEGVVGGGPSDNSDESEKGVPYSTSARVLLSGLGADEVFAGYTRHATAFSRHGYKGLIDEIDLDVGRLGKRNLGRDDRIISHWGREARYPYLDEDFLTWALQCPVWEKCGFRNGSDDTSSVGLEGTNAGELEPGKQALRLVAWNLGMKNVAREKKRAIQFGARTAKMESGRSKGTSLIS